MSNGIKYDDSKPRVAEMVIDFKESLLALCTVWEYGANKYSKSNWKEVDNGIDRYTNAMLRHLLSEEDNLVDSESGLLHAAHIAFNALARLYFIVKRTSECEATTHRQYECNCEDEDSKVFYDIYYHGNKLGSVKGIHHATTVQQMVDEAIRLCEIDNKKAQKD